MKTFYLRILGDAITHIFKFKEFDDLYICECDVDLLIDIDKYELQSVDNANMVATVKKIN